MRRSLPPYILLVLSVVLWPKAIGQQRDFQVWPSVTVNAEVVKNLKLHIEEEIRFHENVTQISRQINDLGLSYRFNKYLRAGVFYRHEADWVNADNFNWRNGFYGDLALRYQPNRFTLGYRLRIQSSKLERGRMDSFFYDGFKHRHKFSALYNIKGIPLEPFVEGEVFINQASGHKAKIVAYRAWAGAQFALSKQHEFYLKYGIDQELNTADPLCAYVIAGGYVFNLKLKAK